MSSIRLFLYVLVGVLSFALFNAWQNDYPPAVNNQTVSATSAVTENKIGAANETSVSASTKKSNSESFSFDTAIPESRLIHVKTDVLDVAIDTQGGNFVKAKLLKYPKTLQNKDDQVKLFSDEEGDFYVARSGVSGSLDGETIKADVKYNSLQKDYTLAPGQDELIVKLFWRSPSGLLINKQFKFKQGHYDIALGYSIDNQTAKDFAGKFFNEISRHEIPVAKGLFKFNTFTGATLSSPENTYEKLTYAALSKQKIDRMVSGGWLAFQQQYFLSAWIPSQDQTHNYYSQEESGKIYTLGAADAIKVASHKQANLNATLYVGPEIAENLKALAPHLDLTVDYGWLWLISAALFWIMKQVYKVVGNWGWSIIAVTLLIKLVFYRFSAKTYASMNKMRLLAPRIKALQERFGNDKQKLSQATMELYRKEKVNPLGGCLPQLIQIPVFIALYYVLVEAVELRQSPFIFWIKDLSVQDPYYVLPILMGLSMFVQQKLNPPAADPMQGKMMMLLPVIFTVFFMSFPAGLVLYWLINNCLSVVQQWYMMKTT